MRRAMTVVACAAALLAGHMPAASASSTNNLVVLLINEDRFYNYDFNSSNDLTPSNVDWGISLVFWNNAEVDKIKNTLNSPYNAVGGAKYGRVNDGGGGITDSDSGRKTIKCPVYGQHAKHYRLYAPSSTDRLYNTGWGYYVLASTHMDHEECSTDKYFGDAERTEDDVAYQARRHGWQTLQDYANFYNYEPVRQQGDHGWNSDGRATYIRVP